MLRFLAPLLALTLLQIPAALAQSPAELCDTYAGHPWEPDHNGTGVEWGAIEVTPALEACRAALAQQPTPETQFRLARTLMQDQLYDEAMPLMFEAVAAGYAPAEAAYGTAHVKAQGVDPDYPTAVYWLEKAAASGNVIGQNNLATMLLVGLGTAPDLDRAISLYHPAAEAGYAPAMFGLAIAYNRRSSGGSDLIDALDWFEKAAAAGNIGAIAYVGRAYDRGIGVPADPVAAFRWYRTAAEAGNAMAQTELGLYYAEGRAGIAQDKPLAREWLGKAAAQLNPEAMLLLGRALLVEPLADADPQTGVAWLERAAAYGQLEATPLLAEYYARAGDTAKARQYAAIALRDGSAADKSYAGAVLDLAAEVDTRMGITSGDALDPSTLEFIDPRAPRPIGQY